MHCGIEFEYLLVDTGGPTPGRIRDFTNLPFAFIAPLLEDKPGRDDPRLATGDLGIRSGYWYLEGDERFDADGRFRTLMVKGVEVRTPPAPDVDAAVRALLAIETRLAGVLARHGLGLAIAGFNPLRPRYDFDPPLNAWEVAERAGDRGYDGSHVSTLSYGPDINLSAPGWDAPQCLAAARRLHAAAPYIVPYSFSSPFHAGRVGDGPSRRTFERAPHRPAVKVYLDAADAEPVAGQVAGGSAAVSALVSPARIPGEVGRIEFKAFDAMPSAGLLRCCCYLVEGICLADDLPAGGEATDVGLYRAAARFGFYDAQVRDGAAGVLAAARTALARAGSAAGVRALDRLAVRLARRQTPAQRMLERYRQSGALLHAGGLARVRHLPGAPAGIGQVGETGRTCSAQSLSCAPVH